MICLYRPVRGHVKASFIGLACMLMSHSVGATEPLDIDYAARIIWQAQQNGDWLPDIYRLNPQLDEANLYSIQKAYVTKRLASGDVIGGYKGSMIPLASIGGVLYGGPAILRARSSRPAVIKLGAYKSLGLEAEIGFKFCKAISQPLADVAALKNAVCAVMPVVEIIDATIPDFGEVKKSLPHLRNTLISINIASAQTLVGEEFPPSLPLDQLAVSTRFEGVEIGTRDLTEPLDLWQSVLWLVNEYTLRQGYTIEPGHFIIPGKLTGLHLAAKGTYRMDYGVLGVLELQVE